MLKVRRLAGKAYLLHIYDRWTMKFLLNFQRNLTSLRFLMMKFTLKYFFHIFVCGSQICCFPRFFAFSVLYSISVIFHFFLLRKICHSTLTMYTVWIIFTFWPLKLHNVKSIHLKNNCTSGILKSTRMIWDIWKWDSDSSHCNPKWGRFDTPFSKLPNDARMASVYVRTCRRVRNIQKIATVGDFHVRMFEFQV